MDVIRTALEMPLRRSGQLKISAIHRIGRGALLTVALGAALATSGVATLAQDATPIPYTPGTDLGSLSGSVEADGSSTVGPITQAVAEEFAAQASGVQVNVGISGTGGGFERFCNGETDVQDASRAIHADDEAVNCATNGVDYYEFEVAYDGITVVVNEENDFVECLSVAQLNQLWAPGASGVTWQDLNPDWPADEVVLYGPGTASGTFDYFTAQINGEEGASTENYNPSEDDNVLVEGVAGDANALGYFGFAYFEANQDRLNAVAVDGGAGCVAPSTETIRDGTYSPLSRPLFVYVKAESLTRPEVQEFMRFYLANAQALVADVGYVDSPIQVIIDDQTKLEGAIAGTVEPDGPGAVATPTS
jgi:phosphate transport system substrate-binding protein